MAKNKKSDSYIGRNSKKVEIAKAKEAAIKMASNERGSKGRSTTNVPASEEQKRKLKDLGLNAALMAVPGGFVIKGARAGNRVYKTISAARKAAKVGQGVQAGQQVQRSVSGKQAKNQQQIASRNEKALQKREDASRQLANRSTGKQSTAVATKPRPAAVVTRSNPKPGMKTVGSSKVPKRGTSGRPAATPANASGLRSLAAKQTVKPQVAVVGTDTKKNPKKDPVGSGQTPATGYVESKRKPKRNPVGSGQTPASGYVESKPSKKSSKFNDEGGKYKQYEWAKKLDPSDPRFQSGYMTQKGYDSEDMEAAKKGGQIKKLTKTKKVVKKKTAPKKSTAKKRNNFSGRGAGAALRGF